MLRGSHRGRCDVNSNGGMVGDSVSHPYYYPFLPDGVTPGDSRIGQRKTEETGNKKGE